jgi:hypothetical protein
MTESKNRYQTEFMRANKTIVDNQQRQQDPSDGFVNDLVGKIRAMKISSNARYAVATR